jgi:hypothetical protein
LGRMLLLALLIANSSLGSGSFSTVNQSGNSDGAQGPAPASTLKVAITTGGGLYGPVRTRFKAGEDIPVVISMINNEDKPAPYCRSSSLFQNRPQLKRDGKLIPYLTNLAQQAERDDVIDRCEKSTARQFYEIQPKQGRVVDWFTLSLMGISWYGELPAGHYELVLQRRISCCQGPWVESNSVAFDVVP